ncbi:MAG TPA: type VI secretion system tip protein TssI/VgrG [Sandaracinaceae bacterium LLY-WYZ-13_1]|nr:type VI secretion system tip protein TssI/VgrG [Sandaracinaceae bacterium LLY-WYZ-13_1]
MTDDREHDEGGAHGDAGGHGGHGGDEGHAGGGHGGGDHSEHGGGGPVGSIAGGTSEVLEGVAGALGEDEEAKEGVETAAEVASTVQKGAKAAEGLQKGIDGIQHGDAGEAASALGGALGSAGAGVGTLTNAIGGGFAEGSEERRALAEAASIAGTVGQVARGVGEIVEGGAELLGSLLDQRQDVHYHLHVEDSDEQWRVHHVQLHEALGDMSSASVEASVPESAHPEEEELLAKDIGVIIERGDERRSFRGIVRHCSVHHGHDRFVVHFDVAPALWLAVETLDSRIYQDITVPDLVEQVVRELVGDRQRSVRKELTETYPAHEYLVQHRESHWEFLTRICQEEGIFLYFDHDEEEREILVLGDSNDNRPQVRPDHDSVIEYEQNENQSAGREVATSVSRHHQVSATDVAVRGFDWTNPGLNVHHERVERGNWNGPRLEHYHHDNAVRHHDYDDGGGSYRAHTADRYSRFHTERLDIRRHLFSIDTTVVTAMPGHTFELRGHELYEGRFLIISASSYGEAGSHGGGHGGEGGHGGGFRNTLECIPVEIPYRPPEPARRLMPGPETATVVGPPGEEIHTDQHGRIKVQFHWDRQGQMDEHSSAWIRVNYGWAGPGWGQIFIPRIGMEVIVSFLGGDPDRPMVMGAVYNGQNPPPYPLPDEKTKSTIKTNSSVGGDGYNELRFEDKKGEEEIWIHAEKDFNEVVEHCHTTHVKNCQTNTVDVDQTETVGNDQTLHVKNDRSSTVDNNETIEIKNYRNRTVRGNEDVITEGCRFRYVTLDDLVTVHQGNREVTVESGLDKEAYRGGRETTVLAHDNLTVGKGANRNVHVSGQYNIKSDGHFIVAQGTGYNEKFVLSDQGWWESPNQIKILVGDKGADLKMYSNGKAELAAASEIYLHVNKTSYIKISASGIEIAGPQIKINATSGTTDITAASQVKIKC